MIQDWKELFEKIHSEEYAKSLKRFLDAEYQQNVIYPPRDMVFQAFKLTSPKDLKVVIIGQDPYHNPGQAMGMSFSVPRGMPLPPSLINIYKVIEKHLHVPLSHKRPEYDRFISDVLNYIESLDQPIVYMLWGGFAKKYESKVKNPKHLVLKAAHPSPLSANQGGWFGKHLFSQCNQYLSENELKEIDWQIK